VGDEVEFYEPMATHGNPWFLRTGRVVGIRAEGTKNRLLLESNSLTLSLPNNHIVKLLLPKATYKRVEQYSLIQSGVQNLREAHKNQPIVIKLKNVKKIVEEKTDDFWKQK